jgi:hypothetical protein
MAAVVRHLSLDITRTGSEVPPPATIYKGLRFQYNRNYNPDGMPAVGPALMDDTKYIRPVVMTKEIQLFICAFSLSQNPLMSDDDVVKTLDRKIAFANTQGWGYHADDLAKRANYIWNKDLEYEEPKLEDGIICAGSLYQGVTDGKHLIQKPGIHAIDGNKPMPTIQEVLDKGWWFYATSWENPNASHFPQGRGGIVAMPHIISEDAYYPLWWFDWYESYTPNNPTAVL